MMIPKGEIRDKSWLEQPQVQKIYAVLNEGAGEPQALFVGGCVRNAVLGAPMSDVDLCTKYTPDIVTDMLEKADVKVIPTGIDHGTVTAIVDKRPFEITTLRKDIETDGRHAQVVFSDKWEEDASRRDFTMNTLLCDIEGNVYDPLGGGYEDAQVGRLVFVGNARERIKEDYLRILRFFRFHAYYGQGDMDQQTLDACVLEKEGISKLSIERVTSEMLKLLAAENPQKELMAMQENGILPVFSVADFSAIPATTHPLGRLCASGGYKSENVDAYLAYFRLSKAQEKMMKDIACAMRTYTKPTIHNLKSVLYFYGRDVAREWSVLCDGDDVLIRDAEILEIPVLPVKGADLIARGHEQGACLGKKLKEIEFAWVESNFDDQVAFSFLA